MRIDRVKFESALGVQQMAQSGLVDDAGGLGLVIQAFGVQADQVAVCPGLAVGHDDMGVQMRVPASRRFVLIRDGHPAGQTLQVFVSGHRVVHAGVAGVTMQVLHGRINCLGVGGGEDFLGDVIGECTNQ